MSDPLTLRTAYRFFVPLIFMTELNMISKSVINAALARTPDQNVTLAAFHIAFTLYFALSSSTEVCTILSLSYLKTRRALGQLLRFMALIVSPPWLVAQLIVFTTFGDWLFSGLFGVSDSVVAQAKTAVFLLSLSAPILVARAICFGLILNHQRTVLIAYANVVRLASLAGSLVVLPAFFTGAAVGAAALVICMAAETVVVLMFARRFFRDLPSGIGTDTETPPRLRQQWRFSWPLILNTTAEMGVVTAISIFLGLLADPDLALAAFNVVYGLVSLLMSPMRNLLQTAQTLVRTLADRRPMIVFTLHLICFFGTVGILLFHTPLENLVLVDAMGLKPALRDYCAPALKFAFLMSAAWAFSALCRGLLAGGRNTTMMALTGAVRVGFAAAIAATTLAAPTVNGAVIGLIGWMAGYTAETVVLALVLKKLSAATAGCAKQSRTNAKGKTTWRAH